MGFWLGKLKPINSMWNQIQKSVERKEMPKNGALVFEDLVGIEISYEFRIYMFETKKPKQLVYVNWTKHAFHTRLS